ncbi:MAG: nucleotidyltransferase family protein [Thermoplasmata archaeon]|nr:nucleotidyltransferase family protein [Thermoplasmata archaeon]
MSQTNKGCSLRQDQSIRDVLAILDESGMEVVLITSDSNELLGILTDGDARRALLAGAALNDPLAPYLQKQFLFVNKNATRAEVLDLMQARHVSQVPIVDNEGRLEGLHTLHEIIGAVERPNWAVVMAGGRGERLRPITDSIPKPMIRVAGRPILERIVLHLVGCGIRHIFFSVNYLADKIEDHFKDGNAFGCHIEYLREERPLGTGGALALLPGRPEVPLIVLNGDLLTRFDADRMFAYHIEGKYRATVGVHEYLHTVPYGVIETERGCIKSIREKPSCSWLANAGIYILDPDLPERVPPDTNFPLTALVEECLDKSELVGAFQIEEDWDDLGQPPDLRRARGEEDLP